MGMLLEQGSYVVCRMSYVGYQIAARQCFLCKRAL